MLLWMSYNSRKASSKSSWLVNLEKYNFLRTITPREMYYATIYISVHITIATFQISLLRNTIQLFSLLWFSEVFQKIRFNISPSEHEKQTLVYSNPSYLTCQQLWNVFSLYLWFANPATISLKLYMDSRNPMLSTP